MLINNCVEILKEKSIKTEYIYSYPKTYSFDYLGYNFQLKHIEKGTFNEAKIYWYSDFICDYRNELDTLHCLNTINYEYEGIKALIDDKGIAIVLDIYPIAKDFFNHYFTESLRFLVKAVEHFDSIKTNGEESAILQRMMNDWKSK